MNKLARIVSIFFLLLLSGCTALTTAVSDGKLNVQTMMSSSIFLPVSPVKKVIYVDVRNTSGERINIEKRIKEDLVAKGYKITNDPEKAYFLLQANILGIVKATQDGASSDLAGGYGGAITGAVIGGAGTAALGGGHSATLAGALIGGIAGTIADALVKDEAYVMVTDVQISQKLPKGERMTQSSLSVINQGSSTSNIISGESSVNWAKYRTRVVSFAEKVNLKFTVAKPVLEKQLASSLAGIF